MPCDEGVLGTRRNSDDENPHILQFGHCNLHQIFTNRITTTASTQLKVAL